MTDALTITLHHFQERFPTDASRADDALRFLATTPDPPTARLNMQGHFTGSAFILNPAQDATLLILHKRLGRWLQPGGHIEANESPLDAALREAHEEVGVPKEALRLHPWHHGATADQITPIDIDSHPIPGNAKKNETDHTHHDLLYLFILDPATPLALERTEVNAAQWIPLTELPMKDRLHHVAKRLARFHD